MTRMSRLSAQVLLAVSVALVLAAAAWLLRPTIPGADPTTPPPSTSAATSPTTPQRTTPSAVPPPTRPSTPARDRTTGNDDRRRWEPVITGFATALTRTHQPDQAWRASLRPYSDAGVRTALTTYNRSQIPDQRYDTLDVLNTDNDGGDLAVQVTYDQGWAIVVYLRPHEQRWLVHAFDQIEQ